MAISPASFRATILPFGLVLLLAGPLLAQQDSQPSHKTSAAGKAATLPD
jgi:hypothetical protein